MISTATLEKLTSAKDADLQSVGKTAYFNKCFYDSTQILKNYFSLEFQVKLREFRAEFRLVRQMKLEIIEKP